MKGSVKIIVFKNMDEILKIVILKKSGVNTIESFAMFMFRDKSNIGNSIMATVWNFEDRRIRKKVVLKIIDETS